MDMVTLLAVIALRSAIPSWQSINVAQIGEATQAVSASSIDQWAPFITEAARRFHIPQDWIRSVMRAESGGHTMLDGKPITSPAGAMGLMQLMPATYPDLRRRLGLGVDPYDPHDNIFAGAAYLRQMFDRYGYPALFAAYNAGPERFEAYVGQGVNLPAETRGYLVKLGPGTAETMLAMGSTTASTRQDLARSDASKEPDFSSGRSLFFALGDRKVSSFPAPESDPAKSNFGSGSASIFVFRSDENAPANERSAGLLFVPPSGEPR